MNTLVIDRQLWQRGNKEGATLKSEIDGKQCCLGFEAKVCGFTDEDIIGAALPSSVPQDQYQRPGIDQDRWAKLVIVENLPHIPGEINTADTDFGVDAAKVNDDETITDAEREQKLIELFAGQDTALSFVN
jgi:hypothetical protein